MGRDQVLATVADRVERAGPGCAVGIDGVDGAGKTTFADELAEVLEARRVPVLRVGLDGFHHPRPVRYRRGRSSPEGFYRDSYDLDALRRCVLDPLGPGGDRVVTPAVHDVTRDLPVDVAPRRVAADTVLLLDGIFLHRPELRGRWDVSVFLHVPFEVSFPGMATRDGSDPSPDAPGNRRYRRGQELYLAECRPERHATFVVDNREPAFARMIDVRTS